MGGKISGRIKKDLEPELKRAKKIIFFLDYDGTLTPIRKRPPLARINKDIKSLLKKLARKSWSEVFIISGRTLKDIKSLIGLRSICYSGNHGIELEGLSLKYTNPTAKILMPHIQKCFKTLKKKIRIKGVIFENKFYIIGIHYRLVASGDLARLKRIFKSVTDSLRKDKKIKITEGKKVLEVRPNIRWDKGSIAKWVLKRIKTKNILPIYIGDDITDEDAFKALRKQGITILVSQRPRKTKAKYRLSSHREVVKFLEFVLNVRGT